jgi:hypothetical protein
VNNREAQEYLAGHRFVGPAGKLLDKVRCRPVAGTGSVESIDSTERDQTAVVTGLRLGHYPLDPE